MAVLIKDVEATVRAERPVAGSGAERVASPKAPTEAQALRHLKTQLARAARRSARLRAT